MRDQLNRTVLLLALMLPVPAWAQDLAVVVDAKGKIVSEQKGRASQPVRMLDYLPAQADITLAAGAQLQLVYLGTSQRWQVDGPARLMLATDAPKSVSGAPPRALSSNKGAGQALAAIEPAHRERMALGAVVMRSNDQLRMLGPVEEKVLPYRVTLRWQGTGRCRVRLMAAHDAIPLLDVSTTDARYALATPLPAGRYTWVLEELGKPGAVKTAEFDVLAAEAPDYADYFTGEADAAVRVMQAAELERAGYHHDARLLWEQVASQRPEQEGLQLWAH